MYHMNIDTMPHANYVLQSTNLRCPFAPDAQITHAINHEHPPKYSSARIPDIYIHLYICFRHSRNLCFRTNTKTHHLLTVNCIILAIRFIAIGAYRHVIGVAHNKCIIFDGAAGRLHALVRRFMHFW